MGVPVNYELALTTRPYYGSTYAFVYPSDAAYRLTSLDDAVLASLRIGVHLIGDDYTNSPPAHALSQRGLVENVVGYSVFGNYAEDSPPGKIVEAVAAGEIDTALVWGPIAGYFAQRHTPPLQVTPLPADAGSDRLPFRYDIAMGVRRGNQTLKAELDALLVQHARPIRAILQDYGVPLVGGRDRAAVGPRAQLGRVSCKPFRLRCRRSRKQANRLRQPPTATCKTRTRIRLPVIRRLLPRAKSTTRC